MHIYLVQPGDTLTSVAQKYHVTPEQLMQICGLPPSPFLLPGQSLAIPSGMQIAGTAGFSTYQVQEGDTLRELSRRFQIPATWLAFCNVLEDDVLRAGDIVLVPHTDRWTRKAPPAIKGLTFDEPTTTNQPAWPRTHRGVRGLRVDASGRLHLPQGHLGPEKSLLFCSLNGPPGVLPQVAKAILQSTSAQQRILEGLAASLSTLKVGGIVFDWQEVRTDCQQAYLAFIKEAGRQLRPMGIEVGLHLPADSPWQNNLSAVGGISSALDHLFFEPKTDGTRNSLYPSPSLLIGVGEARDALAQASGYVPSEKIWLVNRSLALICKQGKVLETFSPYEALQLAYHQGAPLSRDSHSELAWFRTREGGCSVWFEDLWSLVRKIELVNQMKLQGLAMWESGGYFPDAWNYVQDYFDATNESNPTHD